MSTRAKRAYISIMSLLGLVILLLGIFTQLDFYVGLIIAIALWAGSGILSRYWGVKREEE